MDGAAFLSFISGQQVCAALAADQADSVVALDLAQYFFQTTWLASHVRLVTLQTGDGQPTDLLLGWALQHNPAAHWKLENWLHRMQARPVEGRCVQAGLEQAWDDLHESGEAIPPVLACALQDWQRRLHSQPPDAAWELEPLCTVAGPASPYEWGQVQQWCWWHQGVFGFLELRHAS